ncbi:ninjurin-2-like isoform X7 [Rhynchophorus ferrugineus]|uniref:Uncharacterized protein n=1 Tax=Rhynchophorus ferrugineus TaxID=354439 RepID=A0A834MLC8_RHYFE|nr:hypothetical protein GWI33_022201 [Rhynchophorus ferrugineus]
MSDSARNRDGSILDVNKYATKKTIAQGLLDVALLTTNANHLKYILRVGEKHEFYTLMLTLISISIILQVIEACLYILLGLSCNINKEEDQGKANNANNCILCLNVIVFVINIIIACFDDNEKHIVKILGSNSYNNSFLIN